MRRQLTLAAAAIASMIVIAFLVPLGLLVRTIAADRALAAAQQSANGLVPVLTTATDRRQIEQVVASLNTGDPSYVTVIFADLTIYGEPIDSAGEAEDVRLARSGKSFSASEAGGTAIYVPVVQPGRTDVVRSYVPDVILRRGVVAAWVLLGLLGVGLVGVATLVADRMARSIVRPVNELADTAESLSHGDLERRVEPSGPPEIVEVGRTLNQLAGRIDALLTAERESVADISHRLRTPVTAQRLDAESLTDPEERRRVVGDIDALQDEVSTVIRLARRGVGVAAAPSADLVAETRERVEFWGALAEDQGRRYSLSLSPDDAPVAISVDPDELRAALDALLGNVLAHTPDGTDFRVEVCVAAGSAEGGSAAGESGDAGSVAGPVLVVEDDGPGFRGDELASRGASGGGSTGLGLDIVRQTAERTGGRVRITRAASGGARIEITFGRTPPADRG